MTAAVKVFQLGREGSRRRASDRSDYNEAAGAIARAVIALLMAMPIPPEDCVSIAEIRCEAALLRKAQASLMRQNYQVFREDLPSLRVIPAGTVRPPVMGAFVPPQISRPQRE